MGAHVHPASPWDHTAAGTRATAGWDAPLPCIGAGVTAFSAIFFSQPQTRWAYPLNEAEESDTEVDTTLF